MTLALFGIENDGLNLAVNLLVFFLVVIWIALVYWTYADASRRLDDPMLVGCATAASLFPFIGTIVYTIVRPPEYLEDVHERELEIKAAEKRLALLENRTCRNCGSEVEPSYLRCPSCMRKLKEPCEQLRQAARPALARLPVLRGGGGRVAARGSGEPRATPQGARTEAGKRAAARRSGARSTPRARRAIASRTAPTGAPRRSSRAEPRVAATARPLNADAADEQNPDPREARRLRARLTGEVIARFERKGLRIAALKLMQVDASCGEALQRAPGQAVLPAS